MSIGKHNVPKDSNKSDLSGIPHVGTSVDVAGVSKFKNAWSTIGEMLKS